MKTVQKHKKDLKIYTYKELATAFFFAFIYSDNWQLSLDYTNNNNII